MNKTHSRHATATAFVFLPLVSLRRVPAPCRITPQNRLVPPGPPGPAAMWSTHILPRGDLALG